MRFSKPLWQDVAFICAICFNLGAMLATYGIVGRTTQAIGSAGYALEGNFINRLLLSIPPLLITELLVMWGIFSFMYLSARKYVKQHPTPQYSFNFNVFVLTLFFLLLIDFLNDVGTILKIFGLG